MNIPNDFEDDDNDPLDTPVPPPAPLPEDGDRNTDDNKQENYARVTYLIELKALQDFVKEREARELSARRNIHSYRYPGGE